MKADPGDVDVLIACYRLAEQPPEYHAKIVALIKKEAAASHELIAETASREQTAEESELASLYNQFAWLIGNTEGDLDEALKYSRKSVELIPTEGGFYDTLARVYFAKGDLENAVKQQTKAAELEPHSGLIRRQLEFFRKKREEQKEIVKSLAVNGTEIWYVDRGTGLPLLLIHGFPLDHTMWTELIDALAGPGLRVLAPDLRGFGRSPLGTTENATVTMDQFADDLAGWLDALAIREPVVLCGLSMGGYIAFQFWRKFAPRLRGLILCDTRAVADTPEGAAGRRSMAERVLREGPAPLVETMLPKLLADTTPRQRPDLVERLRSMIAAANPQGIAAAARGMAERPDMTSALGQIRCPTLVIVGQHDVISPPAEMRGLAAAIPAAKFAEIPAAGHMSPMENPVAVSGAMREFLAGV